MKAINNMSIKIKLLLLTIPLIASIVIAVIFAGVEINSTEEKVTKVYYDTLYKVNSELTNADRDFYQAMLGATQYYDLVNGYGDMPADLMTQYLPEKLDDYTTNKQQVLDNVDAAVEIAKTNEELYRNLKAEDGSSFEDAVAAFKKDFAEWEKIFDVENNTGDWGSFNDEFTLTRTTLNDMQDITEQWALEEHALLAKENAAIIRNSAIIFVLIIIALAVFAVMIVLQITGGITMVTDNLNELAKGNLTQTFPEDSQIGKDEVGQIQMSAKQLALKLREVIEKTKDMSGKLTDAGSNLSDSASQAAQASGQVTDAVTEISKGAVSQAESVESAAGDTDEMGTNIETIASNVIEMDQYANEMKQACDTAMDALNGLIRQSEEVTKSVKDIGDSIVSTNESVKMISEFTQAITDIAEQTNLLSLNASIEAARAGEAGRGFAVVADEIRQLADQSSTSADKIRGIVDNLLANSEESVVELKKLNASFDVQAKQLDSTKTDMETMSANVGSVSSTAENISGKVSLLTDSKNGLTEVISDLSAISEENAAATQETNASMQELNATFTFISDSATRLQELAVELAQTIDYFKV
ncbi:MAG: methyl-accepting chemotaxis protein [Lachnospiraceae bacterium]|nr:methyl-accepting chemotaxis protein [Lachnospiraceae bacterium]